jgi:(1->4)-alpha-D-glucan 1-alpha-D-glucosylmutase
LLAQFPVYRTYINSEFLSERDQGYINEAAKRAIIHNRALLNEINFLKECFLLDFGPHVSEEEKEQRVHFVMRFQQFTGPLMAKGFEDTLLYVYNRLISLNEVGGAPDKFGIALDEFHRFNRMRLVRWPHCLNATSTHDTKRGEDVRARINVISEIPKEWDSSLRKWNKLNKKKKAFHDDVVIPDQNDEYFFYQTLAGAFPPQDENYDSFVKRTGEYAIKVVREAKAHTAWIKPDVEYENGFLNFVTKTMTSREGNAFLDEFLDLQKTIAHYGAFNSLSQALLKVTAPGVPDFYQGTELWDLSLVDPDNRRPVNFEIRRKILADLKKKAQSNLPRLLQELLRSKEDGRIKLYLTHRLLLAMSKRHKLFQEGSYVPLVVDERFRENIISFARVRQNSWAIAVAPRFLTNVIKEGEFPLGKDVWKDACVSLPDGSPKSWENMITDDYFSIDHNLPIGKALQHFPVALLMNEEPQ